MSNELDALAPHPRDTNTEPDASEGQQPVAVLEFARNQPGNENEMPRVISCNRLPDGRYDVFLRSSAAPTINAVFECEENGIIGKTCAPVKRIEVQDDGSYTVVIDHWPASPRAGFRILGPDEVDQLRDDIQVAFNSMTGDCEASHKIALHHLDRAYRSIMKQEE